MQQTNYHNTGARPKVYASPVSNTNNDRDSISGNIYSNRNPTELPDFVQDHLVIEQCYLNQDAVQPILPDVDNLPDFALNSMEQRRKTRKRQSRMQNEIKGNNSDLCDRLRSVDLTGTLNQDLPHRDNTMSNISHLNHLDLPTFENRLDEAGAILTPPESRGFVFLLTIFFHCHICIFIFTRFANAYANDTKNDNSCRISIRFAATCFSIQSQCKRAERSSRK